MEFEYKSDQQIPTQLFFPELKKKNDKGLYIPTPLDPAMGMCEYHSSYVGWLTVPVVWEWGK